MQRRATRRILSLLLIPQCLMLLFCPMASARKAPKKSESGGAAPRFVALTLDGRQFDNASLEGSVALLQFWTTRCPQCRKDDAALDEIDSRYAGQGMVVLAIDEGDSLQAVKSYLRANPRSVRIALDPKGGIAKRFGRHGAPYYVAIDRRGRIAGTHSGAAGAQDLLTLVSQAGVSSQPSRAKEILVGRAGPAPEQASGESAGSPAANEAATPEQTGGEKSAAAPALTGQPAPSGEENAPEPPKPSAPKVIDVPQEGNAPPSKPVPPTIFVLTNGERLESGHYTLDTQELHVTTNGQERRIPISQLDIDATESVNRDRGVDVKIPRKKNQVFVAF